ncbi:MAG: citrate synthase [Saprospiraceae bacterium]|nr:citrate synthase [Saprospiraceae bacterium]
MSEEIAKISYNGNTYDMPVVTGSEGETGINISKLRGQSGLITLDPGFKNTGSTTSSITFINGEAGVLNYRGYSIEDLAEKADFMEVAYLLINGELPNAGQLDDWEKKVSYHTLVHEDIKKILDAFPAKSHPMGQLGAVINALSTYYPEALDTDRDQEAKDLTMTRMLAKMTTLCSWIYKNTQGHPYMYPQTKYGYVENFLYMTFGHRTEEYVPDPVVIDAVDKLLILHADHEQNCSTSTVKIVGSSKANLYSSIAAGVAALWGPLHGGANQAVIEMLENIKKDGGGMQKWIDKAKDKSDPFRLMGFGHRVYKNFDPRAKVIKKAADDVLDKLGISDPVLELAKELEQKALNDDYFIARKLFPNVDFYSGIIYRALGFPMEFFTVLFALGRLPGWIAQWKEVNDLSLPIGRPRQIYTGPQSRPFVAVKDR